MVETHWHLRITLETSSKHHVEELAKSERRSAANYVRIIIEDRLTARSSA